MTRKRAHHGSRRRGSHPRAYKQRTTLTGKLHVVRPGVAHVDTAEGTFTVAPRGVREGMDGDEVQITLATFHGQREQFAYVQMVLSRAVRTFLGVYNDLDPLGVVEPLDARIRRDFFVVPTDDCVTRLKVAPRDVVVARILEYPTRQSAGVVTIDRRVGSSNELDMNIESNIASFGIATEFPPEVEREARGIAVDVDAALQNESGRRDLRDECCVTVDPVDARDFDDAVSARRTQEGYEVGVHIADVTHYLPLGSSIDNEAQQRACSVYLVDRVIPMLPERLCNDVCSLVPGEDRLCMTVRMMLNKSGRVVGSRAYTSAIRSHARLDYDTVEAFLEGAKAEGELPVSVGSVHDVADTLRTLDEVAGLRRSLRRKRGAIDFDTKETKVVLNGQHEPIGVKVREKTRATSLVEEAMLMANESVARMLADHDVRAAFRVHEQPSPDDLASCVPALMELGVLHADEAEELVAGNPHAIQAVLDRARGTHGAYLANTLLLRAQKRAVYLPQNEGHYALGAPCYCHFTSPIRRYPDDIVHRALKALLSGEQESREQKKVTRRLPQLCRTCSERERVADAAERASQKAKMAELYERHVGECYSGIVVGVQKFGLFVRLDDTCAEGLLPTRKLGETWWHFDEARMTLTGESSGKVWSLGKRVAVRVVSTDPARGQIDFELASDARPAPHESNDR